MRSAVSRVFPARFADCTLDNYAPGTLSQAEALAQARRLADGEITSLVLVGPPGVGKSHLAAAVVHSIRADLESEYVVAREAASDRMGRGEQGVRWPHIPSDPIWENVADLIVALRMEMDRPHEDRDASAAIIRASRHPALVVLDDLGREKASDWTGEIIYSLVNGRYENRLPTLATSNLAPSELAASPYWPVISRLAEDGQLVKITGADHRMRKP